MDTFEAEVTIRRTRFVNDQTGWAVLEATDADGSTVVLVGMLHHLDERERAQVIGTWVNDNRFGMQVKVSQATPLPPSDDEALTAYLRRIKHVGEKRARRLIERLGGEDVLAAIDRDPRTVLASAGLPRGAIADAVSSWERLRVTRQLHLLLAPHGLAYLVTKIHEAFGDGAHRVVSDHPYELTSVFGVGFLTADRIARGVGAEADSPERARAGAIHLLSEAERSGSTCVPERQLTASLEELLGTGVDENLIDNLVSRGDLVREDGWVYRRQTAELEAELAERVGDLVADRPHGRLGEVGEQSGDGVGSKLTPEQWTGVRGAFEHRLSLITGGPGTGKTASIRAIATFAAGRGARVQLVAPTGRAAVRMSEASGIAAKTVHSALGWIPGEGPTHDEDDPLPCDLLIVDETSMASLELLVTLLRAVGTRAHVVLVGDADQLAPVGAGKPFAELVASGRVHTGRLTHIFRQAAGSMIVQGAHAIRQGRLPAFSPSPEMRRDLFLIERSQPEKALREIVTLVCERLPAHYGVDPVADIQVFAPVYRGELGIDALNEALRERLNPDGEPVRGGRLRIGDKLMLTGRNLHDLGLMNGTLLRLLDEVEGSGGDDAALLLAGEGNVFRLPPEESHALRLAYACSVHRGQGIELPIAVIVAHRAAGAFFLRREMLYTAVTRASVATVIVGTREALARAVNTPDTGRRHSRLVERLEALGRAAAGPATA
jgi:exodeoxyribonuclease V alpha subunit